MKPPPATGGLGPRLSAYILIAAALGLAAVVAINAVLFYGQLDPLYGARPPYGHGGRPVCNPRVVYPRNSSAYSRPPYALNPLPRAFERCGLTSGQIADAYAQNRLLASGWCLTLFLSGSALLASGVVVLKMAPNRPYDVLAVLGLVFVGVALWIAAVVSVTLLIETQEYHELFGSFSYFSDARSDARSAATLAMTTLNPLQQVLVLVFAPLGIALALAGLALPLPRGRGFRGIASRLGLLCAALLLAGPLVAIFPNLVLRVLFAIGVGAAPFLLAFLGVSMLRHGPISLAQEEAPPATG